MKDFYFTYRRTIKGYLTVTAKTEKVARQVAKDIIGGDNPTDDPLRLDRVTTHEVMRDKTGKLIGYLIAGSWEREDEDAEVFHVALPTVSRARLHKDEC